MFNLPPAFWGSLIVFGFFGWVAWDVAARQKRKCLKILDETLIEIQPTTSLFREFFGLEREPDWQPLLQDKGHQIIDILRGLRGPQVQYLRDTAQDAIQCGMVPPLLQSETQEFDIMNEAVNEAMLLLAKSRAA